MTYEIGQIVKFITGEIIIVSALRPGFGGVDVHEVRYTYFDTHMNLEMTVDQINRLAYMNDDYLV